MGKTDAPPKRYMDLTGQRFGRWTVIRLDGRLENGKLAWLCQCDCGKTGRVAAYALRHGMSLSCGCLAIEKMQQATTTHGATVNGVPSRLYRIWVNMKTRCYNPNSNAYRWYGAQGIVVCDEWKTSFPAFRSWAVQNGYKEGLSIDRINPCGGYEPNNCQWITIGQNSARADHSGSGRKKEYFADGESVDELRRMLDAGMSATGVAAHFKCPVKQVWAACHRAGIPRLKWSEVERKKAAKAECIQGLWNVGASPAIIHKALGFPQEYIRKVIKTFKQSVA